MNEKKSAAIFSSFGQKTNAKSIDMFIVLSSFSSINLILTRKIDIYISQNDETKSLMVAAFFLYLSYLLRLSNYIKRY